MKLILIAFVLLMLMGPVYGQLTAGDWIELGRDFTEEGKYDAAINAFNEAIRLDPNDAGAWNDKGDALFVQGKFNKAIEAYDQAIELNSTEPRYWVIKGIALANQGKYNEAVKAYDEAIRLDPDNSNFWRNKGLSLDHQGKYDDAIQSYNRASTIDQSYIGSNSVMIYLGKSHYDAGEYAAAIRYCDEVIRLDPKNVEAWHNKGLTLDKLGKYDEAVQAYDKAIEAYNESIRLDPNSPYVWAYNNTGYIWLDPNLAVVCWADKGVALYIQNKYNESIQAYDEAIRLDPNYAIAWYNKGLALDDLGKYDEAIKCFDEAIRLDPTYANAYYGKGLLLRDLNKTSEANDAFAKAKELGYSG